jgi:CheY-like chemotaxis protein
MKKNILIVDNEVYIIELIETMIEELPNIRILTAENVKEADLILKKEKIDVIITDIHMPFIRGDVFIKNIRKVPGVNQNVPVIIASAHPDPAMKTTIPFKDIIYIDKPIDDVFLMETIEKILKGENNG